MVNREPRLVLQGGWRVSRFVCSAVGTRWSTRPHHGWFPCRWCFSRSHNTVEPLLHVLDALWAAAIATAASHATANWQDFVEFPRAWAQSHDTKRFLAVAWLQVMCVEKIGSVHSEWSAALLQPITVQTMAGTDFWESGRLCGTLWFKNGEMNWPVLKARKCLEHNLYVQINAECMPPCIFRLSWSLWWWERAGMISVRSWIKTHLHCRSAVTLALSLVCVKNCGRPQQYWCHDACGMALVSLECVATLALICLHGSLGIFCLSLLQPLRKSPPPPPKQKKSGSLAMFQSGRWISVSINVADRFLAMF